MSTHQNLGSLFEEVVEEYLAIAKMSIDGRKADNGFYGYPATLLLFCIVDSIGQNLVREEKNKIPHNDVNFYMLNHKIFGLNLSKDQLEILGNFYRHKLAHNAIIAKGAFLSPKENDTPFAFAEHGQLRTISEPRSDERRLYDERDGVSVGHRTRAGARVRRKMR